MHYMSGGMSNITTGLVNRVFVIVSIKVLLQQAAAEQTGISSGILQYVMMSRVKESREDGFADKKYITDYLDGRINSWGIYLEITGNGRKSM